ncbi:MAG: DUF2339 domain-containing protein [Chthoniobacterales bacterium]
MDENLTREVNGLRDIQRDLRRKLEELDRRIERVEQQADSQVLPAVKETLQPSVVVPEIKPPAPPLLEERLPIPAVQTSQPALEPAATPAPPAPAPIPLKNAPTQTDSLELRLGRVWLVRIGIVILLTGLVFLGNFAWTHLVPKLGAFGKLAMIYLSGFGLGALGWMVKRKREELAAYGKVLIGGGIATIYYATYAAHFVEPLQVISSPLIGGALLMLLAGGIIWVADRLRSQGIATATIVLGFYTAGINPIAGFSLFSNLVLSGIAITLLLRRRWVSVSFISLIGCYASFAFWRLQTTHSLFAIPVHASLFWTAVLFPACYWVVFTAATFLGKSEGFSAGTRPTFLTINNAAFFALIFPLVQGNYPSLFWLFVAGYGALLIALSVFAAKVDPEEGSFDGAYLTQGLVLIGLGFIFKFSGYQLALLFALQSATLLKLSRQRHGQILQFFSGISAVIAASYAGWNLFFGKEHAVLTASAVSLILLGIAWMFKFQRGFLKNTSFQWRAAGYVALATMLGIATILQPLEGNPALYTLLGIALLATASLYVLRMAELAFSAQAFFTMAGFLWIDRTSYSAVTPFVAIIATSLALMHWWQYQRIYLPALAWGKFWQAFHTIAFVALVLTWSYSFFSGSQYLVALAACALATLLYAFSTRAWMLAIGSQVFGVLTAALLLFAISEKQPWPMVMGAYVIFSAQSLAIELLARRAPGNFISSIEIYSKILRGASLLLGLMMIQVYTIESWQFVALATAAFILFGIAVLIRKSEPLIYAAAALLLGCMDFMGQNLFGHPVFAPDFIGLAFILVAQQIGKRHLEGSRFFGKKIQATLIILGVLGVWILSGRMIAHIQSGFLLTAAWSVLAFVVLGTGFALKERPYRLLGMGILTIAIGRLFVVDVWQLETLYRILSFLVLGAVLLALGFLYNRFADMIRKWI